VVAFPTGPIKEIANLRKLGKVLLDNFHARLSYSIRLNLRLRWLEVSSLDDPGRMKVKDIFQQLCLSYTEINNGIQVCLVEDLDASAVFLYHVEIGYRLEFRRI